MRWAVGLAVALPVCLVALTGCTSTPIPPAANASDIEAFTTRQADAAWALVGLPESDRPVVDRVRYVSTQLWGSVVARCMADQGYDRYPADPAAGDGTSSPHDASSRINIAWYTCQTQYPIDPKEYVVLSIDQIRYLYDYYLRWTIPCIRANGYDVRGIPDLDAFTEFNGLWNPIYHAGANVDVSAREYSRLREACGFNVLGKFPIG